MISLSRLGWIGRMSRTALSAGTSYSLDGRGQIRDADGTAPSDRLSLWPGLV